MRISDWSSDVCSSDLSVGHGAALFPLQLLGCDVAAVPTVILSNHPHYPTLHGGPLPAEKVAALLQGVLERGYVQPGSIIHSGYLGTPAIARVVERFVEEAKRSCPAIVYCCDPVLGAKHAGISIGRAWGRERGCKCVELSGGGGSLKK